MRGQHRNLTPRRREIIALAVKGASNKQIAWELNITEGTVKTHLHRIYVRLGINNRTALAALVHRSGEE